MRVRRFLTGFRFTDAGDDPGLEIGDDGLVYLVAPGGSRTALGSGSQSSELGTKTLTAADLLALDSMPIELLPAPDGRFYYAIWGIVLHYRFGTTPYNEGRADGLQYAFALGYGSSLGEIVGAGGFMFPLTFSGPPDQAELFRNTQDAYILPPLASNEHNANLYAWLGSDIEGKAFSVALNGVALTGGDGTLSVRTLYSLINGAPA